MEFGSVNDDKGVGVVRVKPLGAGGGGGEKSSKTGVSVIEYTNSNVTVDKKCYSYPKMVVPPDMSQESLFNEFMPDCIDGLFDGYNANIIAYGQTGSGKTYTVFGPPGCMANAAKGLYGTSIYENYGLFPRTLQEVFHRVMDLKSSDPLNSYVMTCSAVELSVMGNKDLFTKSSKQSHADQKYKSWSEGVVINKTDKPPRLYGQTELIIDRNDDLIRVFKAIAVRNTAGTLMNDSSSRSHCIVALTLWKYIKDSKKVSRSRLQFCDLAGSERMKNAHVEGATFKKPNGEMNLDAVQGMLTNFSLVELSKCLEDIAMTRKSRLKFSFSAYITDLLFLLSGSLTGNALTACFVCISQAMSNKGESRNTLDFGERFSRLSIHRRKVEEKLTDEIEKDCNNLIKDNRSHMKTTSANNPYLIMREAQIRDCEHILHVIKILSN